MIKSKTIGGKTADILIYLTVIFMTMCCLFPLLNMVAISFSDKAAASANMVDWCRWTLQHQHIKHCWENPSSGYLSGFL